MKKIMIVKLMCLFLFSVLVACTPYKHADQLQTPYDVNTLQPHYAHVSSGQIEYYRFGQGSPIVLISGYLSDISTWDNSFLKALARHHQVIVFNNRNVVGSVSYSSHYESQDLAMDTYQLIKQLHLRKPAVLGISMGGMIAQQVGVLYPHQVGQLILINTAIAGRQAMHPDVNVEQQLMNMPDDKLGRYRIAIKYFFPPQARMRMFYVLMFDRFKPPHYEEINVAKVKQQQKHLILAWLKNDAAAKKVKQLPMPVLILNGGLDQVLPPQNSVILYQQIPHARLVRWPGGGHAMIYQYPEQIAEVVNRFLAAN